MKDDLVTYVSGCLCGLGIGLSITQYAGYSVIIGLTGLFVVLIQFAKTTMQKN